MIRGYPNGETRMVMNHAPCSEYIAAWRKTRRTETSKYPEEKKENSISVVAASEVERARPNVISLFFSQTLLERETKEGESPVGEKKQWLVQQSTIEHEKFGGKMGGPPPKAKYSHVTDSGQVPWGKGEKNPGRGVK